MIASSSCFSFISSGACTFNVEVQWLPWVLRDSNRTHVEFVFKLYLKSTISSPYGKLSQMSTVLDLTEFSNIYWYPHIIHYIYFKCPSLGNLFLLQKKMCRDGSPSSSVVLVSSWHTCTVTLSQSAALTPYCKQVVFVMYLHILLFLSNFRGTWQSTLWPWTSTTCSSSMPVCCMNGASSLPQPSWALWVHSRHVTVTTAVSYLPPCQAKGEQ